MVLCYFDLNCAFYVSTVVIAPKHIYSIIKSKWLCGLILTSFFFSFFILQTTCLNSLDINFVQFLQEIASEQQFEVTYVDIDEKTYSGQYQCLVQLSTLPVAVCQGAGKTSKEAQTSAARNALEYLKIMTKM